VKKLVATPGVVGEFAWGALSRGLAYAARRSGEITDDPKAIDDGMKWGYNRELGPFETWYALCFAETAKRLEADGL
jgi:3-hydroxyacyl-CoA dehydrogenase